MVKFNKIFVIYMFIFLSCITKTVLRCVYYVVGSEFRLINIKKESIAT